MIFSLVQLDQIGDIFWDSFCKTRYFFYLVNPYETMFPDLNVPRYVAQLFPVFILLNFIENFILLLKGKSILRLNDSIASLFSGLFQDCFRIHVRSVELICYCFFYDRFRFTTLPWNSLFTWLLCFISVDFGFYWAHRLAHEVNFIWAIHQAHHSGENFTILAGLRQAVLQPFTAWFTYAPLAIFGIPPQIFLVHLQLTELSMVWFHTEAIESLGPLEYIFNSPSHHRVHHARNRKYIDKNYGGLFIIWDKLFGTFEREDPNEPVVFGLVKPIQSYNIFWIQFHSWVTIFERLKATQKWRDKIGIVFNGPGWSPGKPRLGNTEDIPLPIEYWNPKISLLKKIYVICHFIIILVFYHQISESSSKISQWNISIRVILLLISMTTIGFIIENKNYAFKFEIIRCLIFFMIGKILFGPPLSPSINEHGILTIRITFLISACVGAVFEMPELSKILHYKIKYQWKRYQHVVY